MDKIYKIPLAEIYTHDLTTREWLIYCWLRMGKPANLKKWMTKSNYILYTVKKKLFDKGYLTKEDFYPHSKHVNKNIN